MFNISKFFANVAGESGILRQWGGYIIILLGVVMMIVGIWQICKGLIQHGKAQTNWAVAILLLLIGGALAGFGGQNMGAWGWLQNISSSGRYTVEELGQDTIRFGVGNLLHLFH